jgi:hypothetical protein
MRSSLLSGAIAVAIALTVSLGVQSAANAAVGGSRPGAGAKTETYIVIQIKDDKLEYKAITKTTLKDETKRITDDYNQRYKEWKDEVKSDPKAPRPKKPIIKTMPGATFETQKGADDYAKKLQDEEDEKNGKKTDNPAGTPVVPPRRGIR